MNKSLCLDRSCKLQLLGPHYSHDEAGFFRDDLISKHPDINPALEALKQNHGRTCYECNRNLIPTDEDHSFCEDCWKGIMAHEFERDINGNCIHCGDEFLGEMHIVGVESVS